MTTYINPRAKLLQHLPRLASWQAGKPFAPIGVEVYPTNRCNLGCAECHFGYTHTRGPLARTHHVSGLEDMGDEMGVSFFEKLLPQLQAAGSMVLPAFTNQHPDWRAEVQPTLQLKGEFQIGRGAFRGVPRFFDAQLDRIHAAHLPCADAHGTAALSQHNRIRFHVFGDAPRKV